MLPTLGESFESTQRNRGAGRRARSSKCRLFSCLTSLGTVDTPGLRCHIAAARGKDLAHAGCCKRDDTSRMILLLQTGCRRPSTRAGQPVSPAPAPPLPFPSTSLDSFSTSATFSSQSHIHATRSVLQHAGRLNICQVHERSGAGLQICCWRKRTRRLGR
eukprot:168639-Hanusia_phi.AAC.3